MRTFQQALLGIALGLVVWLLPETVSACPTCRDGLAGDPAYSGMVQGYFWSIIFMMSIPYLILCGIGVYFYSLVRRARLQQATASTVTPPSDPSPSGSSDIALQS